ncbi:WW/Rsp5/WWP [Cladophialophora carrionii]|uniref:WW/Rsp5/WWP n=1 Tax=Cladophialophora carrionii TaxID=86049 RepID=A0A1C1CW59_9EURO|nr:WW/Rsp5/WWP [Cladophialophora carrionii]
MSAPQEAPPSYAQATGSSTTSSKPQASSHLEVPSSKNGIPAQARRSMEDLHRPLPEGWVRQYDPKENHQFFVNTKVDPPKSYWEHPLDIPDVVNTLSSEERERLQAEEDKLRRHSDHSPAHSVDHSEEEHYPPELPARPTGSKEHTTQKKSFGEKFKDKVTGSTHDERVRDRARRAEEERQYYEAHMKLRRAMQQAQITGQPQFFARDRDGKNIYIEPPGGPGYGYGGYGPQGYGINPYARGAYADPNARFIRPGYPYSRPYGTYPGGGYGLPIAGGLLGGMLLGGLMF